MNKILIAMAILATAAFADVKLDFLISVNRLGCTLTQWVENDYVGGTKWREYGRFVCKDEIRAPARMVGLKLLYADQNLKEEWVYTYGRE